MPSFAVAEGVQLVPLAGALAAAAWSTRVAFTKLPRTIQDQGNAAWIKAASGLVTSWLVIWQIAIIILICWVRNESGVLYRVIAALFALTRVSGSAALATLLAIQTVILSVATSDGAPSWVPKFYRVLIWAVAALVPLGVADGVLAFVLTMGGGSDKDMGHLRSMLAMTVIDVVRMAIELLSVLALVFCFVKYKAAFSPTRYYKPLSFVYGLSLIRQLYQVVQAVYFGIGPDVRMSYKRFLVRSLLTDIFIAGTTAGCLLLLVGVVGAYVQDSDRDDAEAGERSPLLSDGTRQAQTTAASG